jgi:uncharacterized membrane protein
LGWIDLELALISVAAILSPTTMMFSVLTLVVSSRPLRSGVWFYLGAMTATLAIGVAAAFVLGDAAASSNSSSPKTWVAVVDVVAGVLLLAWVVRALRRPVNPERSNKMLAQIQKVAASPAIAIAGAGAALANPGGFIPLALKSISEEDPSRAGYVVDWIFFTLVSLLPLGVALLLLLVVPERARRLLAAARSWLEVHTRTIAAVILVALAVVLLRNGITALV